MCQTIDKLKIHTIQLLRWFCILFKPRLDAYHDIFLCKFGTYELKLQ